MATSICDKLRGGVTTSSADETRALAAELAAVLPADSTLALHGDLGVGKTTFVQGLARGFGVTEAVTSPTFNIFTVHRRAESAKRGAFYLVHLDAYRLDSARQVEELLLDEFLVSPWCLAVEWPDRISDWLPPNTLHLDLGIMASAGEHTIRLRG
jgi:tRNA threonylcarbamoyladenosine biosynthesis protein TsaE